MTEIETAYNLGLEAATMILRSVAEAIPPNHAISAATLATMADKIDGLKVAQ